MDLDSFKERLREAESAAAVDQNQFAAGLGLGAMTYRNILTSRRGPSLEILYRIGEAKGTAFLNWLIYGAIDGEHPADFQFQAGQKAAAQADLPDTMVLPVYTSALVEWRKGTPYLKRQETDKAVITMPQNEIGWRMNHEIVALKVAAPGMGMSVPAGAIAMVDIDDRRLKPGGVFVVATPDKSGNWGIYRAFPWRGGFTLTTDEPGSQPGIVESKWEILCVGTVALCCHKID